MFVDQRNLFRNIPEETKDEEEVTRIIAVDDQAMNIEVLRMLLEKKLDRMVECFYSGEEALEGLLSLAQECCGLPRVRLLVLMDINMPDMDGFQATRHMI